MRDTEEAHRLTENIFRNIVDNFTPGVRHVITCGKAYHKALSGVSAAARAYIESIGKVGFAGKLHCKGGAEEIGAAILNLAEVQKEIHAKFEECTKAVFTEVILPLEHKLENDFKNAVIEHRKYQHGHKGYIGPYIKAQEALKKFRKKSKSKYSYDERKETQFMKAVGRTQEKLDEFRVQGLKIALLEERKDYCFLLQRLTSLAYIQSTHYRRSILLLTGAKELTLIDGTEQHTNNGGGGGKTNHNGFTDYDSDSSFNVPYRRPVTSQSAEYNRGRQHSDYAAPSIMHNKTLPHQISMPPISMPKEPQVRAVYTHAAEGSSQLSFNDGDLITLIGGKSDGWQYGNNSRTGNYGWFPLSFTGSLNITSESRIQRAKSIGDLLDSRSISDQSGYNTEPEIFTMSRRPRSLYDSSKMNMQQHQPPACSNGGYSIDGTNAHSSSYYTLPHHSMDHSSQSFTHHDEFDAQSLAASSYHTNSTVPSTSGYGTPRRHSPGVPPPPPPWISDPSGHPIQPLRDIPPPPIDYNTDEEETNPMFASITLRKSHSNDRSAPRIT